MPEKKCIWITWHQQARSKNLARLLQVQLYEKQINGGFLKRHAGSFLWTWRVLIKERPQVIYIQLSFLLLIAVYLYKKLSLNDIYFVADCHTKALRRSMKNENMTGKFLRMLKISCFKAVDLSIISNAEMIDDIEELHQNYIILPDQIPEVAQLDGLPEADNNYVVMVCSFAVDEPYREMIKAAGYLPDDLTVYMTGNCPEGAIQQNNIPDNLHFTGYISFDKYYRLIAHAQCIVGLTTEKGCLQSCAYEGLAVETPMVLSETEALKNYFENAAIYTSHHAASIAMVIKKAINQKKKLIENIKSVKGRRKVQFDKQLHKVKNHQKKSA